jgi:hypothetical protein
MIPENTHIRNSEYAVLREVLNYPDSFRLVDGSVFTCTESRQVWAAIVRDMVENQSVDIVRVGNFMKNGHSILSDVLSTEYSCPNVPAAVEALRENKYRQTLKTGAMLLLDRSENPEYSLASLKATVEDLGCGVPVKKQIRLTHEDLSAGRFLENEPEPVEWLIPGFLARGLVGVIYGEGGAYKSLAGLWLCLQMASSKVHASQKWLDNSPVNFCRTGFFSAEDMNIDLHSRSKAITDIICFERPEISPDYIRQAIAENCLVMTRELWVADGQLFLTDENGDETPKAAWLIDIIKDAKLDLVVLETYSRIFPTDENDNSLAAKNIAVLEKIRDQTGATILVIAHSSKQSRFLKTDAHGQNGLRGAGALMDNARWGLWFRNGAENEIEIINSKNFRCKRVDKFSASVDFPKFEKSESEGAQDVFDMVLTDIKTNPGGTQRQIRGRVGKKQTIITQSIRDLIDEGLVEKKHKGGYHAINS